MEAATLFLGQSRRSSIPTTPRYLFGCLVRSPSIRLIVSSRSVFHPLPVLNLVIAPRPVRNVELGAVTPHHNLHHIVQRVTSAPSPPHTDNLVPHQQASVLGPCLVGRKGAHSAPGRN